MSSRSSIQLGVGSGNGAWAEGGADGGDSSGALAAQDDSDSSGSANTMQTSAATTTTHPELGLQIPRNTPWVRQNYQLLVATMK